MTPQARSREKVSSMEPEESATGLPVAFAWQSTLFLGVVTLALGLIVSFHPSGSLNVIAVLLGVLLIISGIFHLLSVFESTEPHRVWLAVTGLLLVVIGVLLIRHLHLTLALIGLVVGISWIVQGLSAFAVGLSGDLPGGRAWWVFFGFVSLAGGIVVVAAPVTSVTVLAVLLGIWFAVMGLVEIASGFMLRHATQSVRPAGRGGLRGVARRRHESPARSEAPSTGP
jgi:uncharacterized membrane protein HdeD (DUF308 family)